MRVVMDVELMVRGSAGLHPFRVRGMCAWGFRGRRLFACGELCSAPGYFISALRAGEGGCWGIGEIGAPVSEGSSALPGGEARVGTSGLLAAERASCATGNGRGHSVRRGERGVGALGWRARA